MGRLLVLAYNRDEEETMDGLYGLRCMGTGLAVVDGKPRMMQGHVAPKESSESMGRRLGLRGLSSQTNRSIDDNGQPAVPHDARGNA